MSTELERLVAARDTLVEQAEAAQTEIDDALVVPLREFFDFSREVGTNLPCRPGDYRFDYVAVTRDGERSYVFSHDCRNHGYDLPDTESVFLPVEFVEDRETYTGRLREAADAKARAAALARREALRRELSKVEDTIAVSAEKAGADQHGNVTAREGLSRCECGSKYWEDDMCVDCKTRHDPARHDVAEVGS